MTYNLAHRNMVLHVILWFHCNVTLIYKIYIFMECFSALHSVVLNSIFDSSDALAE